MIQWGIQITRPKIRSLSEKPSLFGLFRYLQILSFHDKKPRYLPDSLFLKVGNEIKKTILRS